MPRTTDVFVFAIALIGGCEQPVDCKMELNLSSGWDSDINQLTEDELSSRWRDQTKAYVTAVNVFFRRGMTEGWMHIDRSETPKDITKPMAEAVLNAIRRANEVGNTVGLHERFPRSHSPFIELLRENGQSRMMK